MRILEPVEIKKHQAHFLIKAFISYVYFIQGFYLNLGSTVTLLYPQFPTHDVLSHFSIAFLPFSFKYLTAPFVEKFTTVRYGRRKFWIVFSLLMTTVLSFPLIVNLTDQTSNIQVVALLFIILLFVSMGDIAIDAASVKQLQNPILSSILQLFFQSLGNIAGGLLMMKVIKPTDWWLFKTQALCSPEAFTLAIGIANGLVGLLIHIFYKERVIKQEEDMKTPSFKRIFSFYKHFLNPRFKLCRFGIYLLVFWQGLKFFMIGFQPEAINRGFPKETLPEIHTVCIFISIFLNSILSRFVREQVILDYVKIMFILQLVVYSVIFSVDSFSYYSVFAAIIAKDILHLMTFLLNSSKVNTFGEASLAGLAITTLASLMNFGNNAWLQLKVISLWGYHHSVVVGLGLSVILAIFSGRVMKWIEAGQDGQIQAQQQALEPKKD